MKRIVEDARRDSSLKARVCYVDAGTKGLGVDLIGLTGRELKVIVDNLRRSANMLDQRVLDLEVERVLASSRAQEAIELYEKELRAASQEARVLSDNIERVFREAM